MEDVRPFEVECDWCGRKLAGQMRRVVGQPKGHAGKARGPEWPALSRAGSTPRDLAAPSGVSGRRATVSRFGLVKAEHLQPSGTERPAIRSRV